MKIYIPTRGRERQRTVERLGVKILQRYRAALVCSDVDARAIHKAYPEYEKSVDVIVTPKKIDGIAATRQYILDDAARNGVLVALMLDDDLPSWSVRESEPDEGQDAKYHSASSEEIAVGLREFDKLMLKCSHGSIGHRLFCQRHPRIYKNSRMLRALAYNVPKVTSAGAKFRLRVMEDFDIALQLLTQGHEAMIYNALVQDQSASNVAGGCSIYRTEDVQTAAACALHDLWPDYVTLKIKKGWAGMAERTDVQVNWRKAFKAGAGK